MAFTSGVADPSRPPRCLSPRTDRSMTDLLEKVLAAHGGLGNWRNVAEIYFRLTLRGRALELKQQPNGLRDVLVKIDARRPRTLISPFPAPGSRGVFEEGS